MKTVLLITSLMIAPLSGHADYTIKEEGRYAIQIGAFSQAITIDYSQLSIFGNLYEQQLPNGITRIRLGNYSTMSEAQQALGDVHTAGFNDAFITAAGSTATKPTAQQATLQNPQSLPIWNRLSHQQQKNIVYLDGVLHLKEGEHFTPLAEYSPE